MLACGEVYKSYRMGDAQVPALRGASFRIDEPGFYAVMGASGSGKSTLLHLLACLDRPDRGTIELDGQRLDTLSEKDATQFRRRGVGIVFQQFNLIPTLTARQNAELPGMLAGEPQSRLHARSGELLERLGLQDRMDHRPDALSGGEQQRVAIARALMFSPPLILADEPTGNLDSASSERLWALLAQIACDERLLVVMVTHEPAAAAHCRSAMVLQDGRVKATLNTEGLDAAGVAACYQQCVHASN